MKLVIEGLPANEAYLQLRPGDAAFLAAMLTKRLETRNKKKFHMSVDLDGNPSILNIEIKGDFEDEEG